MTAVASEPVPRGDQSIRALTRSVAEAADPQIVRIVATVDAMAARGGADALIEPLRRRLGALRPARPLRLSRLLFHPLDPVIVPAARWKPEHCTVPRTVIAPMTLVVREALGAKMASIEAAIGGLTIDDADPIMELGRTFWPEAASILAALNIPAERKQTGLDEAVYLKLARKVAAVLSQAPLLDALCVDTAQGLLPPNEEAVERMLRSVASTPDALPMQVAVLLSRLPQAGGQLSQLESKRGAGLLKAATEQAAELLLDLLERAKGAASPVAASRLADAGAAAARVAGLLNALDHDHGSPLRRKQVRDLRQRLDDDCRARFIAGLSAELLTPLRELPDRPDVSHIMELEAAARGLRGLETEARTFGGGPGYDLLLAQAADAVQASSSFGVLQTNDRVRMVEILVGSDTALAMLQRSDATSPEMSRLSHVR